MGKTEEQLPGGPVPGGCAAKPCEVNLGTDAPQRQQDLPTDRRHHKHHTKNTSREVPGGGWRVCVPGKPGYTLGRDFRDVKLGAPLEYKFYF